MRAVITTEAGGPEVLTLTDVPTPEPGPGQLLIAVTAAGVNRADILQRPGHYPPPPGESDLIGLEVSGHVAALGADYLRGSQIEQPVEAMGRTALGLLMERLHTPDLPVRKVVMQGRCIVRGSTQAAG